MGFYFFPGACVFTPLEVEYPATCRGVVRMNTGRFWQTRGLVPYVSYSNGVYSRAFFKTRGPPHKLDYHGLSLF